MSGGAGDSEEELFSRHILLLVSAFVSEKVGYSAVQRSACLSLADVGKQYLETLTRSCGEFACLGKREGVNVFDVLQGAEELGQSCADLRLFCQTVCKEKKAHSLEFDGIEYPLRTSSRMGTVWGNRNASTIFDEGSVQSKPAHVPAFLPVFPEQHTFRKTEVFESFPHDESTERREQTLARPEIERSLANVLSAKNMALFGDVGETTDMSATRGLDMDGSRGRRKSKVNPFLSKPVTIEERLSQLSGSGVNGGRMDEGASRVRGDAPLIPGQFVKDSSQHYGPSIQPTPRETKLMAEKILSCHFGSADDQSVNESSTIGSSSSTATISHNTMGPAISLSSAVPTPSSDPSSVFSPNASGDSSSFPLSGADPVAGAEEAGDGSGGFVSAPAAAVDDWQPSTMQPEPQQQQQQREPLFPAGTESPAAHGPPPGGMESVVPPFEIEEDEEGMPWASSSSVVATAPSASSLTPDPMSKGSSSSPAAASSPPPQKPPTPTGEEMDVDP